MIKDLFVNQLSSKKITVLYSRRPKQILRLFPKMTEDSEQAVIAGDELYAHYSQVNLGPHFGAGSDFTVYEEDSYSSQTRFYTQFPAQFEINLHIQFYSEVNPQSNPQLYSKFNLQFNPQLDPLLHTQFHPEFHTQMRHEFHAQFHTQLQPLVPFSPAFQQNYEPEMREELRSIKIEPDIEVNHLDYSSNMPHAYDSSDLGEGIEHYDPINQHLEEGKSCPIAF